MATRVLFEFVTDKMTWQILFNSFGQKGTLITCSFIIVLQYVAIQRMFSSILTLQVCDGIEPYTLRLPISRVIQGLHPTGHSRVQANICLSRDGGFPLSSWLYHVNRRVYAPVRCVRFAVVVALLLGLLFARRGQKNSRVPFHLGVFSLIERCHHS